MTITRSPIQVQTTAALRIQPVSTDVLVLTVCDMVLGDDRGGLYRWDPDSSAAEDTTFMNVIASSLTGSGRWVRFAQRTRQLPQGILTNVFGVKTLIAQGIVASGACTFNLTMDNTPTGEAIFSEVWENRSYTRATSATAAGAVMGYPRSITADRKQTTHGFARGTTAVNLVLGLLYSPLTDADNGTAVGLNVQGR